MERLNKVSETALITLKSRVMESEKQDPVLHDPLGAACYLTLLEILPEELRERILKRKLSPVLTSYLALRARKYDQLCREFLVAHPGGMIVSLGCGFDTRFWRLGAGKIRYLEVDLPEVVQLKKEILGKQISYYLIEGSVLDKGWIDKVRSIQSGEILFLAEGLFMYLPATQVIQTLQHLAESFQKSRLAMEVVHTKYTRGIYKKMAISKMKRRAGTGAGEFYQYGIRRAIEVESYHPGYKVVGEWSFFEDKEVRPTILKLFRPFRSLTRTQYTIVLDIV